MTFPLWYTTHYQDDDAKKLRKIAARMATCQLPEIAALLEEMSEVVSDRLVPREIREKVTRFNDDERFTRGYSRDFLAYIVTYLGIWKGGPYRTVEFKVLDEHYQITRNPRDPVSEGDQINIDGSGNGPSGGHRVVDPIYEPPADHTDRNGIPKWRRWDTVEDGSGIPTDAAALLREQTLKYADQTEWKTRAIKFLLEIAARGR